MPINEQSNMGNPCCSDCCWWYRRNDQFGFCTRRSPLVFWESENSQAVTNFPETHKDLCCGQWDSNLLDPLEGSDLPDCGLCRYCGDPIRWVRTSRGKPTPVNDDGQRRFTLIDGVAHSLISFSSHFETCSGVPVKGNA